jgi:hypothetical protein
MKSVDNRSLRHAMMLPAIFAAAGCAPLPAGGVAPEEAHRFEASTARQVRRCYRSPRVASVGRQIVTKLRVRYAPDGSLIGMPVVLSQSGVTPVNRSYAAKMAEAASLAVIRCAPIHVPDALARYPWNELELLFSPRMQT